MKVYDVMVCDMSDNTLDQFALQVDEDFDAESLATEMSGKAVGFLSLDGTLYSYPSKKVRVIMIPREGK